MDFVTTVEWSERHPGKLHCQNGQVIDYSAPAELQGMTGPLTPEDAFVAAANMCYQIVFKSVSAGLGLKLVHYRCRAVGDLQTIDGVRKFAKITLYPEMRFGHGSNLANLQKAIETSKRKCLVTNSMALEVEIVPKAVD